MHPILAYLNPVEACGVVVGFLLALLCVWLTRMESKSAARIDAYNAKLNDLDKRAHAAVTAYDLKVIAQELDKLPRYWHDPRPAMVMSYLAGRMAGCVPRTTPSAPKPMADYVYTHPIPAEPPEGYRFLGRAEPVFVTDRAFDPDTGEWTADCASAAEYEESYAYNYHAVIRKA